MVSERQALVAKGVEDAEAAGALLAEADKESGKRITTAESQAEGIVQSARAEAGVEKARLMQEAESRAAQVERDAQARALEATERAKRESEKEIARLAILTAQKLMQKS
jgi:F0F1-type ATP synthase membrane subunit b/b'